MKLIFKSLLLISMVLPSCARAHEAAVFNPSEPPAHDPVAISCDGTWYLFCTGVGIDIYTSDDLLSWNFSGHVFDKAPQWALESVPGFRGHIWAPDIAFHDGQYYLYYSCSSFGKNDSAIGVATSRTLDPSSEDYGWTDHGCVVRSVGGRDNWNAIDPNLFIDKDGTPWLSFGSFWGGVKIVQLDSTLCRLAEPQVWYPLCTRPEGTVEDTSKSDTAIKADSRGKAFDPGNNAVEAPYIIYRNGWYYLFVSYDLCCRGPKSTYNVVAGRSEKVTGPYLDRSGRSLLEGGGTRVLSGNKRYPGVGHCAVVGTPGGDVMFFHGYDKEYKYNSHLLSRPLVWDADGWPIIEL